jgi:hypothetical protein
MAVLSSRDAEAWHRLGIRVAPVIQRALDQRVLANRSRAPIAVQLAEANRLGASLMDRSPVLLRTDVASFYPSVTPPVLAWSLRSAGVDPADANLAADMLEGWGSEGYPGLPIGPPASGVLANTILRPADLAVEERPFLRWVDDYLIAAENEDEGIETLERLDQALAIVGLERSRPKTRLVSGSPDPWLGVQSGGSSSRSS